MIKCLPHPKGILVFYFAVLLIPGVRAAEGEERGGGDREREIFPQPEIREFSGTVDELLLPVGEKLDYRISWTLFKVANASIEILPLKTVDGIPAYHLRLITRTNAWAEALYKVRDRIDSYMSVDLERSLYYTKLQEGRDKRDVRVVFQWPEKLAQRTDYSEPWIEDIHLKEVAYDPLGITYAFRKMDFDVGERLEIHSTDGKTLVPVDVKIRGRETVKTPLGRFRCILVEPDIRDLSGVFNKSPDANIFIWFNAEPPHVPVRMKSELPFGAFDVRLHAIEGPRTEEFLRTKVSR